MQVPLSVYAVAAVVTTSSAKLHTTWCSKWGRYHFRRCAAGTHKVQPGRIPPRVLGFVVAPTSCRHRPSSLSTSSFRVRVALSRSTGALRFGSRCTPPAQVKFASQSSLVISPPPLFVRIPHPCTPYRLFPARRPGFLYHRLPSSGLLPLYSPFPQVFFLFSHPPLIICANYQ
jgi:hypothetical protein